MALTIGLLFALLSMTTAMAQVERGGNRIYGIRRDRPALHKYGRAAVFTRCWPSRSASASCSWSRATRSATRWSASTAGPRGCCSGGRCCAGRPGWGLLVLAIAVLFDHAPRRRQPALSLAGARFVDRGAAEHGGRRPGSGRTCSVSASFSSTYGPLAGVFALLLWSLLSSMGLFYGLAVCAQLEAVRAGDAEPAYDDPGRPHHTHV